MKYRIVYFLFLSLLPLLGISQEYCGTSGLLALPTAEVVESGTFRGGAFYLSKQFTPDNLTCDGEKYNTGCYFISLAPWKWIEMSYACTLLKFHRNNNENEPVGYYNEDRKLSLKLYLLYEGKWWPSVAIGCDDLQQFVENLYSSHRGSSNYQNAYIMVSKHFDIKGYELSAHVGYRYFIQEANKNRRGVAGGLAFVPRLGKSLQGPKAWIQRPRLIVEWDGVGVNVGADVLLWRHLFVQAALIHGSGFMGGIGYHYRIKY